MPGINRQWGKTCREEQVDLVPLCDRLLFSQSGILREHIYLLRRKVMEIDILTRSPPAELGKVVLQSQWVVAGQQLPSDVCVHSKAIVFQDQFIVFEFGLRFSIKDDVLTFRLMDRVLCFGLVSHGQEVWSWILRQYLNQMGFHQQFKPVKKIGKGNYATVYLVERLKDGKQFAVKAFSKETAFSERHGKECLIKEIQIMRSLSSPFNLSIIEVFESENSLYFVFELIKGGQLFEKIRSKQKLTSEQVQLIMKCLLEGLKEMHDKGIMHRDLKPENILLRSQNSFECVIADFGLAEFSDLDQYLFVRCGTPGYVAPEIINLKDTKAKYSPVCDLFSLGLIFHLLIFGTNYFKGKNYSQMLNQNRNCKAEFIGEEYQHADPVSMNLLTKLLEINPFNRISARQALLHPYIVQKLESRMEDEWVIEEFDTVAVRKTSILSTNSNKRKQEGLMNDSCLSLRMGRGSLLTGTTQTAGNLESGKLSGFGASLLKTFKPSKFSKASKQN